MLCTKQYLSLSFNRAKTFEQSIIGEYFSSIKFGFFKAYTYSLEYTIYGFGENFLQV
jgi:hypothetical protein